MTSLRTKQTLLIYFLGIAIAVTAAVLVRTYWIEAYRIPSHVMSPSLVPGDLIFVQKWGMKSAYQPRYGDMVVYRGDLSKLELLWIKRVIGIPGDWVELKKGRLFINDKEVPVRFETTGLNHTRCGLEHHPSVSAPYKICEDETGFGDMPKIQVEKGQVFLMGDFRVHGTSQVDYSLSPISSILGRARYLWISFEKTTSFWPKIRWERSFQSVN